MNPNVLRRNVDVLIGGQWGSEGKGNIVSRIAGKYTMMIRTGGPNAGHQVRHDGKSYTFHHLPSGCVHNRNALLVLEAGAVIYPRTLFDEMEHGYVDHARMLIHPQAVIIQDEDRQLDISMAGHIGTTGQGVGTATIRKLRRRPAETVLARDVGVLAPFVQRYEGLMRGSPIPSERILVEGTQGTLLSVHHGDWPYVTSRDTTAAGVLSEAGIPPGRVNRVIMVVRTFPIRVQSPEDGTSGPMGTEITWADVARASGNRYKPEELAEREKTTTTKRQRRVAEFDMQRFIQAYQLNGPTDIALTFADYMNQDTLWRLQQQLAGYAPVTLQSHGFGPEYVSWLNEKDW